MTEKNLENIWAEISKELEKTIQPSSFDSWIRPLFLKSTEADTVTIATNSTLSKEWVSKNFEKQINEAIKLILGEGFRFEIVVDKSSKKIKKTEAEEEKPAMPLSESQVNSLKSLSNNLNLKYTFENFVVGSNNKFAHAAAMAVAKEPATNYNPLFIYGGAGLGKTHLMQAIGHHILFKHPSLKIKYTKTEAFTNDLIASIRSGKEATSKMSSFRQKYRYADVLLIDDIQFIESKIQTQEEIFHTFDYLYNAGKQIIITSDRPPKDIPTLSDRLRSRFEWGLLADIQVPDIETRIAILQNKAEADGMDVPLDILEFLATVYQSNIRELEGALNRVFAYVSINECPMTIESVKKIINFSSLKNNLSVDKIIEETAKYFKMEPSEIKGQKKSKDIAFARQIATYLARDLTQNSFPSLGESFGGRKHTTMLYSYEKIKEDMQMNNSLAETISEITKKISG